MLANLENGRRPKVSLAELLVIARALEVPPALLVFTIGRADQVELPGATTSPWQATKRFCGKETFESFMLDDDRRKGQLDAALPVQLFREHDKLTREVLELRLEQPS